MITGLYAGILALIFSVLSFNVIIRRVKMRTLFGDNNMPDMTRAVRIHGNFAEYVPFILLLMALYEMQRGNMYLLHVMGIALVIGRLLHVWGLNSNFVAGRLVGTVITQVLLIVLSLLLILKGITLLQVL